MNHSILSWNIRLNYLNIVLTEYNGTVIIDLNSKVSEKCTNPIALQRKGITKLHSWRHVVEEQVPQWRPSLG